METAIRARTMNSGRAPVMPTDRLVEGTITGFAGTSESQTACAFLTEEAEARRHKDFDPPSHED